MAACAACGTTILFGGTKLGETRYCNANCARRGQILATSRQIPPDVVSNSVAQVYRGQCPRCKGPGPVDVRSSFRIWSAVLLTRWQSFQHIACRSCGVKAQLLDTLFCLVLGWWGFPWGLIMTPVQISRNVGGMMTDAGETGPSPKLENAVRIMLATNAARRPQ